MKTIRINFTNCWDGPKHNYLSDPSCQFLCKHYNVEISDDPEYLFCEVHGNDDLKYNCVKIVICGENIVPDFFRFDYVIGFDYISFGDRYLRFPLYARYGEYEQLKYKPCIKNPEAFLRRKFCSFVVSNAKSSDQYFYRELSKYKK